MSEMRPVCYIDMDGVLADFVRGVCEAHNRETPYSDPESYGNFDMAELWGMGAKEFWSATRNSESFWTKLKKLDGADELVSYVTSVFGTENTAILTAPSLDPQCVPGKRNWIRKHYPELAQQIIFTGAKQLLARPNALLIDDRDTNIQEFKRVGGIGVLMPRLWNSDHTLHSSSLQVTIARVQAALEGI